MGSRSASACRAYASSRLRSVSRACATVRCASDGESRAAISSRPPDVCHAFTIKPAIFATLGAKIAGVPRSRGHHHRAGICVHVGWWITACLGEFLYRMALRHAQVVFFQNSQDRQLFVDRRLVMRIRRNWWLVRESTPSLSNRPVPSVSGSAPVFLMIGRLLRDKGVLEYLAAARFCGQAALAARACFSAGRIRATRADSRRPNNPALRLAAYRIASRSG